MALPGVLTPRPPLSTATSVIHFDCSRRTFIVEPRWRCARSGRFMPFFHPRHTSSPNRQPSPLAKARARDSAVYRVHALHLRSHQRRRPMGESDATAEHATVNPPPVERRRRKDRRKDGEPGRRTRRIRFPFPFPQLARDLTAIVVLATAIVAIVSRVRPIY